MARFDIKLNPITIVDYFSFPNHFFNIILFRDERTINITAIVEQGLVLNATDSALV
jgi:hypothetical protein